MKMNVSEAGLVLFPDKDEIFPQLPHNVADDDDNDERERMKAIFMEII